MQHLRRCQNQDSEGPVHLFAHDAIYVEYVCFGSLETGIIKHTQCEDELLNQSSLVCVAGDFLENFWILSSLLSSKAQVH